MAVTTTKENICIGKATTLSLGGADLGPTDSDGVVMNVSQSHYDHKNDQISATIKKTLTNREISLSLNLTEASLENMHLALNEAVGSLSLSSLTIDDTEAAEAELLLVGVSPGGSTRSWIFDACVVRGSTSVVTAKDAPAILAMEIEAIYSVTESRFGIVGDA